MQTRTKWFLGVLGGSIIVASVMAKEPRLIIDAGVLFVFCWLIWRGYVFLSLLLSPIKAKLKPVVDPINSHFDDTLRRSGLGRVADLAGRLQSGLDNAVKTTQDKLDARR